MRFQVTSQLGNVRLVRERVRVVCADLGIPPVRLDAMETAVAEAAMNAIEHGNGHDASLLVEVRAWVAGSDLVVRVAHEGTGGGPPPAPAVPELEAKLRSEQPARGWGLFLMRELVDRVQVSRRDGRDGVELVLRLDGRGCR